MYFYDCNFSGEIEIDPPLTKEEQDFLVAFCRTRHYVDGEKYNTPTKNYPSRWCDWTPNETGTYIEWDGVGNFAAPVEWLRYLIDHFIGQNPLDRPSLPFLRGHTCNGEIIINGPGWDDVWKIKVKDNVVKLKELVPKWKSVN